ncbi:alkene reductase [Pseudomonas batumici]|uniref:Flavoprotein NADH-dependent oxidoreductase n=1 Tax=Pseudomonas batumici TaxID=226910 RepID=A0A0C2I951_9PSED|nr:alkene reductase [Pseudomonas batumici]KIH83515.1 Flavoprotein NADH-dependent oxidoreductase [Pseudomonas batumici]
MTTQPSSLLHRSLLGDLELRNSAVMAPLTRARATNPGHVPNDLMRLYYQQRATAGLIISEGTWVSEDGQGWYGAPGLYTAEQVEGWKAITDAVHAEGGLIFAQLWHQGAVSLPEFFSDGRLPIAPSAVNPGQLVHGSNGLEMTVEPRAMTRDDIKKAIADFRHAAEMAKEAGFDGVQIQAGYVYLIQQFLHETTNLRTDEYGGSIENRARFLFDVLEAVLEVWPSHRVGVKTGPMMNEHGALKATESTLPTVEYVYKKLSGYNLSHLLVMRQQADLTGTPIAHLAGDGVLDHVLQHYSGNIIINTNVTIEHGQQLLDAGLVDGVAFGREFIANPDLVERIRLGAALNEQRPEGYYRAGPEGYTDYPRLID